MPNWSNNYLEPLCFEVDRQVFVILQRFERSKEIQVVEECKEAFQKLKEHLGKPPLLSKPVAHEPLYIYMAVLEYAISAALVNKENRTQLPIYYVSKRLVDVKTCYLAMEKLAYSLVVSSRKL